MTIESNLERIATALEKLASGQGSLPLDKPVVVERATTVVETATPPVTPRPRGRPPKVQPAPEPTTESVEPEAPEEADGFLDVTDAAPVYTIEQVREAIVGYQKKTGDPEKARKLLKSVGGVDTLRSLPESRFGAIVEACKK